MKTERQDILDRLDFKAYYSSELSSVKWYGKDRGQALCPFHNDTKPSLAVSLRAGQFRCFGCDKRGSVFDFYMERHGVDFKEAKEALSRKAGLIAVPQRRIIKEHSYKDEARKLLYQTVRYEPKDFRQRKPDGREGWIWNLEGVRLVPYKLPELLEAQDIIIAEGEKDADALSDWGLVATCNPMGAGKWQKEYNQYFRGKRVAILPDNDKPGRKHAQTVAKNLKGIAESVKVVELPGLQEKGDISDYIKGGGTKENLMELITQAPEWTSDRSFIVGVDSILTEEAESIEWGVSDLIPEGSLILLTAPPSHYKTFLALDMACCVSQGLPFIGRKTKQKSAYFIEKENPRSVLRSYLKKLGVSPQNSLQIWPSWVDNEPPIFPNDVYLEIAGERPLMIFDSLIRFYPRGTDENSSTHIAGIMGFLRGLTKAGATVLVLHHKGKGEGSDYRGSSDILGGVDIAYSVKKSENPAQLTLKCFKSRYSMEKDFSIEIIGDKNSIQFKDAAQKIAQERNREEAEKIEALKRLINMMGNPTKTNLIKAAGKELDISEHRVRRLLERGKGRFWVCESGKHGAIYYRVNETCSDPQPIYNSEKLNTMNLSEKESFSGLAHLEFSETQKETENEVIEVTEVIE